MERDNDSQSNVRMFPSLKLVESSGGDGPDDDIPVRDVLDIYNNKASDLAYILVMAVTDSGELIWDSNSVDVFEVLWMIEALKKIIMDQSLVAR